MTTIQVATSASGNCHEFTFERGPAVIVYDAPNYLQVTVQNSAHKVWRGAGKVFHQADRAARLAAVRAAYKSASVHAAVDWLASSD